ncbi:hypothetical protein AAZX31_09G138000 [Glycine max]|uniref:TPX2 central domain-containing protein n=1 Tax=Glycine max TaxID=3847 RepID=K7LE35_SOYBN|nr:uncharacterized protein LOC100800717 [Glycine max]KAG5007318.1 hypothetical protein JHK85_025860 [Glycine max]KAH1043133.1 hypothetical protein GYH30_025126 [Glycine max]KRH38708.1 hypothetical protein GLYMA_09G152500v4 [Glycine max]|eukprot:XP_003534037.2 uncharacterized protein LOC100800717 isoform X1 [Glycine max]
MEEEFEVIEVEYAPLCEGHEIDVDYEFDAPQFFNFKRQLETFWDATEVEQWFEFAPSYPPSPFLLKTKWGNCGPSIETEQVSNIEENNSTGLEYCNETIQDTLNGNTKPLSKSSSSKAKEFSFMKPTTSHLAKQKNPSEVQNPQHLRFQRQNSSPIDGQLTKRQKLGSGYLRKVARLKHHIIFTHKKTKEVDHNDANLASKSNVTIAKEPNLMTALRAHRHKPTQSSSQVLKAKSLNKKILEGPTKIFSEMKTPQPTQFQVFHLRTSQRAMQNTYNSTRNSLNYNSISNNDTRDLRTNSSVGSRHEKCRTNNKLQGSHNDKLSSKSERGVFRNIKVYPLELNDNGSLNEPPTKFFGKLSLASNVKQTTKSPSKEQPISKDLKENNRPGSLCQEH